MAPKRISLDDRLLDGIVSKTEIDGYNAGLAVAEKMLAARSGPGNDFLGWLDLPTKTPKTLLGDTVAVVDPSVVVINKSSALWSGKLT